MAGGAKISSHRSDSGNHSNDVMDNHHSIPSKGKAQGKAQGSKAQAIKKQDGRGGRLFLWQKIRQGASQASQAQGKTGAFYRGQSGGVV